MATQVVELTGKEANLLRSLQKVIDKEVQHEKQLAETGRQGTKTGDQLSNSMDKFGNKTEQQTKRGKRLFDQFGKNAVTNIAGIATGFASVGTAISVVNTLLEDNERLLLRALDAQVKLAAAQQESAKNLAGISPEDRRILQQEAVPRIAAATGFGDIALIDKALGQVASAGESNAKRIEEAVTQAARLTRLTPEELGATAAAGVAVQRQVGLADVRQALALVQTTGTQAFVQDPALLQRSLPGAIAQSVATVRGQDREEAARQAAALFAQLTQGATDEVGAATRTFQTDFVTRLRNFFKPRDNDPGTLFGRIEALQRDTKLRAQFLEDPFGEKRFQIPLEDLTDANSELAKNLKTSFQVTQANTAFFEGEAKNLRSGSPQRALATAQSQIAAGQAVREGFATESGALAFVRSETAKVLEQTRPSGFFGATSALPGIGLEARVARGGLRGVTAAEEGVQALSILRGRISELRADGVTDLEREQIAQLNNAITAIRQFFIDTAGELKVPGGALREAGLIAERDPGFAEIRDLFKQIADGTTKTAENTQPSPPNLGATQRAARGGNP